MHKAGTRITKSFLILLLLVGLMPPMPARAAGGNIGNSDKYAWSESGGWINFKPTHGGVTVHDAYLSGYAWAENIGWIKLGADTGGPYANDGAATWGVNRDGSGNLSGYAWSEATGWVNFNPTYSQVTVHPTTGVFDGYAWSENLGWIHFKNLSPAYNVLHDKNKLSILSQVEAGGTHTGQIKSAGSLWVWGNNASSQLGYDTGYNSVSFERLQVGSDVDWARVSFGNKHSVALKTDGSLWAWGDNSKGQLGDGTYNSVSVPTRIGDGYDWKAVSTGWEHTLALKSDGTLWAWGYNLKGQLGLGDTTNRNLPAQIEPYSFDPANPWTAVKAGPTYALALKADGTLWGWGDDWHGQLGQGTSEDNFLLPVQIDSIEAPGVVWTGLAAGYSHVLALDSDGHLWAWGDGDFGQLGNGTTGDTNMSLSPMEVSTETWGSVAAGYDFSAALKTDGTLWTWGTNDWGQLGNGSGGIGFFESMPGRVGTASDWIGIDCGNAHLAALQSDGTVSVWGSNQNGQLGDGTMNDTVSRTVTIDPVATPTNENSLSISGTMTETGLSGGTTVTVELEHTDPYGDYIVENFASTFDEATGAWSATVLFSDDAEYTLTVTAENATDIYTAQARDYVVFDSTGPQPPNVTSVSAATQKRQPTWTWSGAALDGFGTFRFQLDNSIFDPAEAGSTATSFQPAAPLGDGSYTLYVQERDEAGNWSTSSEFTIVVDNVPPAAPAVSAAAAVTNNRQPTWTWGSGGEGSGSYRYDLDGGGWNSETTDTTFTPSTLLSEAAHTLYVQERDAAGNWSPSGSLVVEVDITAPWLGDIAVASPTNADSQQIIVQADVDAIIAVTVDTAASVTYVEDLGGQWFYNIAGLEMGGNSITVTATDPAGNDTAKSAVIYRNSAPTVDSAILDQIATEDTPFTFAVPAGTFNDVDGDTLTLAATLDSGSPLPAWLGFAGGIFTGTPENGDVGSINVEVTATDPYDAAVTDVFVLTVANVNEAPTISGQSFLGTDEETALTIALADLTVTDQDNSYPTNFTLTVQAGANYTVSGATVTPAADFNGTLTVPVFVNDGTDDSNTFNLRVDVAPVNDAPLISGTPVTTIPEDSVYSLTPTVVDIDAGDTLAFSITSLPSWAIFETATGALTGTPTNADVGTTSGIMISVTDAAGASAFLPAFDLVVTNVNDAPAIGGTPSTTAPQNKSYMFQPTAEDADAGDSLTFSIANKPSWASFDSLTGLLSGIPTAADVGTTAGIVISVTDAAGASAFLPSFDLTVNDNQAPTVANDIPDQVVWVDTAFHFTIPPETFADADPRDSLTLTASLEDGSALPGWLDLRPSENTLWGTPFSDNFGTIRVKVTATDKAGAAASDTFTLHVAQVAPAQNAALEWGSIEVVSGAVVKVPLVGKFDKPVVVTQGFSDNGKFGLAQLKNVTSDSFELVYTEPVGNPGESVQIFYLVAETGEQDLDGLIIQAGTLESSALLPEWETIAFTRSFALPPAVFAAVQTANGSGPVLTRVHNCSERGVDVVMQEFPAGTGGEGSENLGWIAIEKGIAQTDGGRSIMVLGASASSVPTEIDLSGRYAEYFASGEVSEKFARLFPVLTKALGVESYSQRFTVQSPILIGGMTSTYEADPAVLKYQSLGTGSVELFVREEQGSPHALEDVSIFLAE